MQVMEDRCDRVTESPSAGGPASLDDLGAHFTNEYQVLFKIAFGIVRSREAAHDAVQEAYADTAAKIKCGIAIDNLSGWLYRVVQYECRMRRRRRPTLSLTEELDDTASMSPPELAQIHDRCEEIYKVLRKLKPVQRSAFVLAEVHGFNYREIGARIGRNENGVRQLLFRTRRHVRESIGPAAVAAIPLKEAAKMQASRNLRRKQRARTAPAPARPSVLSDAS